MKASAWGRVLWMLQVVFAGFRELEAHERRQAREIAKRVYRDRRLTPRDRDRLIRLARKAGRGAARNLRRGGVPRSRRR